MRLFRTKSGVFAEEDGQHFHAGAHSLDALLSRDDLPEYLAGIIADAEPKVDLAYGEVVAPIEHQEVWAAGVTYYRSRGARMEEVEGRRRGRLLRSRLFG